MSILSLFKEILNNKNYNKCKLEEYDFVCLGKIQGKEINFNNNIGYLLQIREYENKLNITLIRHPKGDIIAHENQDFYHIKEHLLEDIKKHFNILPKQESNVKKLGYIYNGIEKKGFFVKSKRSISQSINKF